MPLWGLLFRNLVGGWGINCLVSFHSTSFWPRICLNDPVNVQKNNKKKNLPFFDFSVSVHWLGT